MFREGKPIGPYKLVNRLGRGAFGEVWLAERKTRYVTTKFAVKLPLDDQVDHQAIEHEAVLWAQASGHPNVLPLIEAEEYDGQIVIVSEYAPDGSLEDLLQKNAGPIPLKQAVEFTIGILNGLDFLHSRKIIHRDIKPANILLQGKTPRLADFGISRVMRTDSVETGNTGTPYYMAPEAFDKKRNAQTDIWSVGVVLYRLLKGEMPFDAQNITDLLGAIITGRPEPLPDSVPLELQEIVLKALAKKPAERYQKAEEMEEALAEFLIRHSQQNLPIRPMTENKTDDRIPVPPAEETDPDRTVKDSVPPEQTQPSEVIYEEPMYLPEPKPAFDETDNVWGVTKKNILARLVETQPAVSIESKQIRVEIPPPSENFDATPTPNRRRSLVVVSLAGLILLGTAIGLPALYLIQNYLRSGRILPNVSNPFSKPEGVANSDINLRAGPSANNDLIGSVPKNSRVRIVNSTEFWYEIDIIEFSRPKENSSDAEHGWVNKRYIEVSDPTVAEQTLIPYRKGDKFGFSDINKKVVIEPKYSEAFPFSEGLAVVGLKAKYGVIDQTGKEIVTLKYDQIRNFVNGIAVVAVGSSMEGRKFGLIDKYGQEIVSPKYDFIGKFNEGLARVSLDKKYGFIDENGFEIISLRYDLVGEFSEGLASVNIGRKEDANGELLEYGKHGYIDKTGKEVIPLQYLHGQSFSEGLAPVIIDAENAAFIDLTGNTVIKLKINIRALPFSDGIAPVRNGNDGKSGYIDKAGNKIIALKYDFAGRFYNGLARVGVNTTANSKSLKWGFIDKKGTEIVSLNYDRAFDFVSGLAVVNIGFKLGSDGETVISEGKYGFIDSTGKEVIQIKYDSVSSKVEPFLNGLALVLSNGREFYIDKKGTEYYEP